MILPDKTYVLVTAAYNEEKHIEATIESVVAQTLRPLRWIIVSDGSTDRTDEIVDKYRSHYGFIELVRIRDKHARNFAAQVHAINLGCKHLEGLDYDFIANVDADVTFTPDYYARLVAKFEQDNHLGLAGGFIYENVDGEFKSRDLNSERNVAHAVQMFRRKCFDSFGGYVPLPYGGPDWHALVTVRMLGWRVKAFCDLPVFHHRPGGTAERRWRNLFREGRMDYSVGSYPPFEVMKLIRRIRFQPYFLGSAIRCGGFLWGYCQREERMVSPEFIKFLRGEQKTALRTAFLPWLRSDDQVAVQR